MRNEIHEAIERERQRSRYRDRCSGARVHPVGYDVVRLVDFCTSRRRHVGPSVLDAARSVLREVDTGALRFLVATALHDGQCNRTMRRRCERVIDYCELLDAAALLLEEPRNDN